MPPRPVTYHILCRFLKRLAQTCCHWITTIFVRYFAYKYILTRLPVHLNSILFRGIAYITSIRPKMDIPEDPDDLPRLSEALAELDPRPMLLEASRQYEALRHRPPAPDFSAPGGQARDLRMTPFAGGGFVANTQSYPGSLELVEHYRAGFLTATDLRKLTIQDKHKLLTICFAYKSKARVLQYLDCIVEKRVRWAPRLRRAVRDFGRDSCFDGIDEVGTAASAGAGAENRDPSGAEELESTSIDNTQSSVQGTVTPLDLPPGTGRRMNLPLLSPAGGISIPRVRGETYEKISDPEPPITLHVPTPSWALPSHSQAKPNDKPPIRLHVPTPSWALPGQFDTKPSDKPPIALHVPTPSWALPAQSKTKPSGTPPTELHVPRPLWAVLPHSQPKPNDNAPPASPTPAPTTHLSPPHSRPKPKAVPAQEDVYFIIQIGRAHV